MRAVSQRPGPSGTPGDSPVSPSFMPKRGKPAATARPQTETETEADGPGISFVFVAESQASPAKGGAISPTHANPRTGRRQHLGPIGETDSSGLANPIPNPSTSRSPSFAMTRRRLPNRGTDVGLIVARSRTAAPVLGQRPSTRRPSRAWFGSNGRLERWRPPMAKPGQHGSPTPGG